MDSLPAQKMYASILFLPLHLQKVRTYQSGSSPLRKGEAMRGLRFVFSTRIASDRTPSPKVFSARIN